MQPCKPLPPLPDDSLVKAMNHLALRDAFTGNESSLQPLDFCLKLLHKMGKEVCMVWDNPSRGMEGFNALQRKFQPALEQVHAPGSCGQKDLKLREIFSQTFQEGTDTRDLTLYNLHQIGHNLLKQWDKPDRSMHVLTQNKMFEELVRPRLESALFHLKLALSHQTPKDLTLTTFTAEVNKLLQGILFLNFDELITSPRNQRVFLQHLPETKAIFSEMEAIGAQNTTSKVKKKALKLQSLGFNNEDKVSENGGDQLRDSYAYSACAYTLCERHCVRVTEICAELEATLSRGIPSSNPLVTALHDLLNSHLQSPEVRMYSNGADCRAKWTQEVIAKIRYRYLDGFKQAIMPGYRKMLVDNLRRRPVTFTDRTMYTSFNEVAMSLTKMLTRELSSSYHIAQAFSNKDQVRCFVDGQEVVPDKDYDTLRYDAYLRACSSAFGDSELFSRIAKAIGLDTKTEYTPLLNKYPAVYTALMNMSVEDLRRTIKTEDPEKALRFFKVFQNILAVESLQFFTQNVLDARKQKFNLESLGFTNSEEKSKINNTITLSVEGSLCTITIVRINAILDPQARTSRRTPPVWLRQEYSLKVNVAEDRIYPPTRDMVSLSVECSPERLDDPEIKTLLFNLRLIMESLDYPPLVARTVKGAVTALGITARDYA